MVKKTWWAVLLGSALLAGTAAQADPPSAEGEASAGGTAQGTAAAERGAEAEQPAGASEGSGAAPAATPNRDNPADRIAWERREQEARRYFLAGRQAYQEGRFETALKYFEKSYELSGRPALLWNIATAADRLRRTDRAIEAFELFLAAEPDSPLRPQVEARLQVLREEKARLQRLQEEERRREEELRRLREEMRRKEQEAREREARLRAERERAARERAAVAEAPPREARKEGGGSSAWVWIGVGAAVVAGGAVAAVLLMQPEAPPEVHPDATLAVLREAGR